MTGPELRAALDELGLTQGQFAELTGEHRVTISSRIREVKGYQIPARVVLIIGLLRRVRDLVGPDRFADEIAAQLAQMQQAAA
jgi:hypothetical protein